MNIKILYEDKDLIVIDKPSGLSVHPDAKSIINEGTSLLNKNKYKTLVDWILEKYPKIKNVGEPLETEYQGKKVKIYRPGIVHRLDKDTSGALIIAKNNKTFDFLKKQFKAHLVEKTYRAIVYGYVSDIKASLATSRRGLINAPIGRSPKDIRLWTAGRGARPPLREAVTEYVVLKKFRDSKDDLYSYLEIYPKTGRTHQIRVHMRYINHPIVSDPLYYSKKEQNLGIKRLALHSFSISFKTPNGSLKKVEAPLPEDFQRIIKENLA
jgi:23S rRNA pseudouridine1911/1915/1917 synthase